MSDQMFKAWDNHNKKWIHKDEFNIYSDGTIHTHSDLDGNTQMYNATLCRSTGLKDKNGVMIFEGDIIEYFINGNSNYRVQIGEIVYSKRRGAFMIRPKGENFLCLVAENIPSSISIIDPETNIQIIGNIFQNANLLEAKQ